MHSSGASQDVCRRDHEQFQCWVEEIAWIHINVTFLFEKPEVWGDNSAHVGHLRSVNNGVHSSLSRLLRSSTTLGPPRSWRVYACAKSARENRNAEMLQAGFKMSRLYIAKAPSFSSLEAFVVCLSIPREGKGAFLQMLKAKCRSVV